MNNDNSIQSLEKIETQEQTPSKPPIVGKLVGASLGTAAGAINMLNSSPVMSWLFTQELGKNSYNISEYIRNLFHNDFMAKLAYNVVFTLGNTIMKFPAILPVAGGLILGATGAIIDKRIQKCKKLKRKNLKYIGTKLEDNKIKK